MIDIEPSFKGWAVVVHQHVTPCNDARGHDLSLDCWCRPKIEENANSYTIIHRSADRREVRERASDLGLSVIA